MNPNASLRAFAAASLFVFAGVAAHATDTDLDGLVDIQDNCIGVANADQIDSDDDNFGNACDADLNNDGIVNVQDLGLLRSRFFTSDADADFNGDGTVNVVDLGIMRNGFFAAPGPSGVAIANTPLRLRQVYDGIALSTALSLRQAPNDPSRWYALQRAGQLISFSTDEDTTARKVVMNTPAVDTSFEGGALGLDFHPDFANNGYIFISYTTEGPSFATPLVSRISRFDTSVDPSDGLLIADPSSEEVILAVDQPFSNHNGGNLLFGPDGLLYWGLGDGGSGGDPQNHGQRTETMLGAMVRIDIDVSAADFANGVRYYIPSGNPFSASPACGQGDGCPEIFAFGLRNPWRWRFDRETGELWAGDVGQSSREEVDIVTEGGNYGWRCREGNLPFSTGGCPPLSEFTPPVYDYGRNDGFSITGGYVYRGFGIPGMQGMYFFSDLSSAVWGIFNGDYAGELLVASGSVLSFAEDLEGELYVLTGGDIFKLELAN
ncbi:MAG: PQQ-dependent sugar dehydrogenase [Gammaproteobacteria bacterium]